MPNLVADGDSELMWDLTSVLAVKGFPGKLTLSDDSEDVDLEALPKPQGDLNDAERDAQDSEHGLIPH